ncbi:MAG: hypothetical protein LAN37_00160 [Acidobacteriia bacterium]|nr:hypothetical protein [Terriglobia bacterium]
MAIAAQSFLVNRTDIFLLSAVVFMLLSAVVFMTIAFVVMRRWFPAELTAVQDLLQSKRVWVPLCAAVLVGYLLVLFLNTIYPGYLEHVEPNIASVSFIVLRGAPLYHELASTQRYTFPYGPVAYLPFMLALRMLGANVLSLKLVVLLANLCLLALLWRSYRKLLDPAGALLVTTTVVVYLLLHDFLLQVRGDVLVILSAALGLYAAVCASEFSSTLLLALACGLSFDIKFTAPLYFAPLFVLLIRRRGWRPAVLAAAGAGIVAVLPFFLPGISAARYVEWVQGTAHQPLSRIEVARELKFLLILFSPFLLLLSRLVERGRGHLSVYLRDNRSFLLVSGASLAAIAVSSSKLGAGPHHFMPFYPTIAYACADLYNKTRNDAVATPVSPRPTIVPLLWCCIALLVAAELGISFGPVAKTLLLSRSQAAAVAGDLEAVMKSHPGKKIEMGYGGWNAKYKLTYFRPALVFAGNPFTIDVLALGDMQLSGVVALPASTLEYVQQCKTQIWLIPKGDAPFSMINVYSLMDPRLLPERPVFSDEFRRLFFQRYRKQPSSQYYDIWECGGES